MFYIVLYEGEPVFLSQNKQMATLIAKLYTVFYWGVDFETRTEGSVTFVIPNVPDAPATYICALNVDDSTGLHRIIEAMKPEKKEDKIARRNSGRNNNRG